MATSETYKGGPAMVKTSRAEMNAGKKTSPEIEKFTATRSDNGGWHVECEKKAPRAARGGMVPYVRPSRYTFEDSTGLIDFIHGIAGDAGSAAAAEGAEPAPDAAADAAAVQEAAGGSGGGEGDGAAPAADGGEDDEEADESETDDDSDDE